MIARGEITADPAIDEAQIQPASIDLRLGTVAYRVPASFLPGPTATVAEKLASLSMHEIDLTGGAVLEKGCVYIVEVLERVDLPARVSGTANPKSSTGRLDIFTRLISDRAVEFESVPAGYQGPLYTETLPRTFDPGAHRLAPQPVALAPRAAGDFRQRHAPPAGSGWSGPW